MDFTEGMGEDMSVSTAFPLSRDCVPVQQVPFGGLHSFLRHIYKLYPIVSKLEETIYLVS